MRVIVPKKERDLYKMSNKDREVFEGNQYKKNHTNFIETKVKVSINTKQVTPQTKSPVSTNNFQYSRYEFKQSHLIGHSQISDRTVALIVSQRIETCTSGSQIFVVSLCMGWKAIPANQAMYAVRRSEGDTDYDSRLIKVFISCGISDIMDFSICHDDFTLKPADGVLDVNSFPWLGFIQYVHITTGMHHHSKAPRVVLVHKQFALSTASDVLRLPKNYKLGNVVFGEYYRDEEDCGVTRLQAKKGIQCPKAYIEVPVNGINPHPEFSRFGVSNSVALIKLLRPMRSQYMLPACLPTIDERINLKTSKIVFMVDYISLVPHDFEYERMGKKTLRMYTHRDCKRHRRKMKVGKLTITHALCSSGCGVRPGAPIVSHADDGTFELIGLTAGAAPCSNRSMRRRLNDDPPLYSDVYPYKSWIVNVITAHLLPYAYPQNFMLTKDGLGMGLKAKEQEVAAHKDRSYQRKGWKARTYCAGNACFASVKSFRQYALIYSERFEVNADPEAKVHIHLKVSCGVHCHIACARLTLPNRYVDPVINGLGGYNITAIFASLWFPEGYYFSLALYAKNSTAKELKEFIKEQRNQQAQIYFSPGKN